MCAWVWEALQLNECIKDLVWASIIILFHRIPLDYLPLSDIIAVSSTHTYMNISCRQTQNSTQQMIIIIIRVLTYNNKIKMQTLNKCTQWRIIVPCSHTHTGTPKTCLFFPSCLPLYVFYFFFLFLSFWRGQSAKRKWTKARIIELI